MKLTLIAILLCVAHAAYAACNVDVDCMDPGANHCGGMVCQWGGGGHVCVAAGTDPQGMDGWCTSTADCKCAAAGATCAGHFCTFTVLPPDMSMPTTSHDMAATVHDMAGTPPADLSVANGDLAISGASDLSVPADPGPTTKKSGCAVAGAEPLTPFSALALSLFAVVLIARSVRARSRA